ncbi:four helix bundle protein [Lutimonas halocynthiae]|uniref:four helix bundle protein n=1 Tax=Lutimonas halocynthiae TaxID=1446477 RepID=UPI0025B61F9A|nr:four helix bundle protein [Lutimonas halocynthiae]MDN3643801.1 four helix bundle protein [Lutimonas halocynthiae]
MSYKNELTNRLLSFAANVIKYSRNLPKSPEFKIIKYQLIKSVTSVGANYRESQSASSLADFRSKVYISLKEISETTYWLEIISSLLEIESGHNDLNSLLIESRELEKILGSIIQKTKISKS